MWPGDDRLTETLDIGHEIRRGDLVADVDGADHVLSPVLRASSSTLTEAMLGELTLLRGLDIPFYISHHTGGYLGNFGRNDGEFEGLNNLPYIPTIDQVMAWSDGFAGSAPGVVKRSMNIGYRSISYGWDLGLGGGRGARGLTIVRELNC